MANTASINALALDAYNRITIGGIDPADLPAFYANANGEVEYHIPHAGIERREIRDMHSFTSEEIAEAITIAERRTAEADA